MDLMKKVKVGKKYQLKPRKLYVYSSTKKSIERLASRPGFFQSCEAWRNLNSDDNFMSDVYDGKLWKDWNTYLDIPGNLLVCSMLIGLSHLNI